MRRRISRAARHRPPCPGPPHDTNFCGARAHARTDPPISTWRVKTSGEEPLPPMAGGDGWRPSDAVETEAVEARKHHEHRRPLALILPLLFVVFRSLCSVGVGPRSALALITVVFGLLGAVRATLSAAATASAAMLSGLGVDGVVPLYVAYTPRCAREPDGVGDRWAAARRR